MCPNFKSLADKERKRRALLAQLAKDEEIDRVKQEAYELAEWATDAEKKLELSKIASKTTLGTQTDSVSNPTSDFYRSLQERIDMTREDISAPAVDIGDEHDSLSDMEDSDDPPPPRKYLNAERQKLAKMAINEKFHRFPELVKERIHSIKTGGLQDDLVYLW